MWDKTIILDEHEMAWACTERAVDLASTTECSLLIQRKKEKKKERAI